MWILAASLAGVLFLVLITRLVTGHQQARLADEAEVGRLFGQDYPEAVIESVTIMADRRAALLALRGDTGFGLVLCFGDRQITRMLEPPLLCAVSEPAAQPGGPATLTLKLRDFSLPRINITLEDEAAARIWREKLLQLTRMDSRAIHGPAPHASS